MESGSRSIMYVGNQLDAPSIDRPNGRPDRVWHGPGFVVHGIPPIQAYALTQHKDEWADVTELKDDERKLTERSQAVRLAAEDRVRKLRNPVDAPNNKRNVDALSDEELVLELERRRAGRKAVEVTTESSQTKAPVIEKGKGKPKKEASLTAAIGGAVERISAKVAQGGDDTLMDENGVPTLAAVSEELGYPVTEAEYSAALNEVPA